MARVINEQGLALIKEYEGCQLTSYPDPGSGDDPWTIGYGHTGQEVVEGVEWTQAQADAALAQDITTFSALVDKVVPGGLTSNQFSALVSFAYNLGVPTLRHSTLLTKLNALDVQGAADQFPEWCHSCGKELPGLVKRRAAERALFLTPDDAGV